MGATVDPHASDGGFKIAVDFMNYGKEAVILSKELWAKPFDNSEWSGDVPWVRSAPESTYLTLRRDACPETRAGTLFSATPYVGNNAYALNLDTIADLPPVYSISADKEFFAGKTRIVFFALFFLRCKRGHQAHLCL